MKNRTEHIGEKITFFETKVGGRIVRVSANLRPKNEGNITWQLATRTKVGVHWSTTWIRLEDMEQLGFLFLALSKFCVRNRYMSKETYNEIMVFKKKWKRLVDRAFRDLKTRKALLRELKEKCGIGRAPDKE
nr:hypothetical protein [Candidatus Njordarchaeota archaeon]